MYLIFDSNISIEDIPKEENLFASGEWTLDSQNIHQKNLKLFSDADYSSLLSDSEIKYLDEIYDQYLRRISKELNSYHKVEVLDYKWEVLIGPWLRMSIFMIYIKFQYFNLIKSTPNLNIVTQKMSLREVVPLDINEFHKNLYSDSWNSLFFSILGESFKIRNTYIESKKNLCDEIVLKIDLKKLFKGSLISLREMILRLSFIAFNFLRILLPKKNKIFLYYVNSPLDLFYRLIFMKFNMPLLKFKSFNLKKGNLDKFYRLRQVVKIKHEDQSKLTFDLILHALLKMTIPNAYLEGFGENISSIENFFPNPSQVDLVMTSTAHWNDDAFKLWYCIFSSTKTRLIIWQHGGTYGTTKHPIHQEYIERRISNLYLTWGWEDPESENIQKFRLPFSFDNGISYKKTQRFLLVLTRLKNTSRGDPWDSSIWNRTYLNSIVETYKKLEQFCNVELYLRPHPSQLSAGMDISALVQSRIKNVKLDQYKALNESISNSGLVITTQNSTVFLQCLASNRPVICFWDTNISPLNSTAGYHFSRLESVGIFHNSHYSALNFIQTIKDDIDKWWFNEDTQRSINSFCSIYTSTSSVNTQDVLNYLNNVADEA